MKIKELIFNLFKKLSSLVSGRGLAKLPFATKVYQFIYKRLKPDGIIKVVAEGHKMFVDSKDTGMVPYLIMHGKFAPEETEILKKILKKGMIFVDIGANIGYFSLIAAGIVGDEGRVYAFEPDENNFSLLEKNIKANGYKNIIPVRKAVSNKNGKVKFYLNPINLCAHSLSSETSNEFIEVESVSLDEFFKNNNKIDVIKIDVEGVEPEVLRGMKNMIKENGKLIVITEFFPEAIKRFGHLPRNYLEELQSCGFKLYRIDEPKGVTVLDDKMIDAISRGEKIKKLINIFAKKV